LPSAASTFTHSLADTVKAYEIYQQINPSLVSDLFTWIRENDRALYNTPVATLAANRKLRPVFVQKKSFPDQVSWLHKTLKLKTSDTVGEHLFQVWLMKGQKGILTNFCDGMDIAHDGEGTVEGGLPEELDAEKLKTTVDSLISAHDPQLVALYLHVFNLQTSEGWGPLTDILEKDNRLALNK